MGAVTGIIIGNILGAGKIDEAKDTSRKLMAFSTFFCTILAGLYVGLAFVFPDIYNTTDDVKHIATTLMIAAACFVPIEAIVNAAYFTIRAGGRTFITFLFDSFFTWVIPVPAALMLSRLTNLDALWMYVVVQSLEIIKVILQTVLVSYFLIKFVKFSELFNFLDLVINLELVLFTLKSFNKSL